MKKILLALPFILLVAAGCSLSREATSSVANQIATSTVKNITEKDIDCSKITAKDINGKNNQVEKIASYCFCKSMVNGGAPIAELFIHDEYLGKIKLSVEKNNSLSTKNIIYLNMRADYGDADQMISENAEYYSNKYVSCFYDQFGVGIAPSNNCYDYTFGKHQENFSEIPNNMVLSFTNNEKNCSGNIKNDRGASASNENTKTIYNIKAIQTFLEMYYNEEGKYPDKITLGAPLVAPSRKVVITSKIPSSDNVATGICRDNPGYVYKQTEKGLNYTLIYCLEEKTSDFSNIPAGVNIATPAGVY